MTGESAKTFHGVGNCPLSKILAVKIGALHLCYFWAVVLFNTWLISSWEENNSCNKLSNWQPRKPKMTTLTIVSEINVILCICSALTTFIFFSVWDKSCVKWDEDHKSEKTAIFAIKCTFLVQNRLKTHIELWVALHIRDNSPPGLKYKDFGRK